MKWPPPLPWTPMVRCLIEGTTLALAVSTLLLCGCYVGKLAALVSR